MTHHFGEPDPERPGSLFEKPKPPSAPAPTERDAETSASTEEQAADAAPGHDGRTAEDVEDAPRTSGRDDVRDAPATEVFDAAEIRDEPAAEDRAADEFRGTPGDEVRAADGGRDAEFGRDELGSGAGGGGTDDPLAPAWTDDARGERGAGVAGAAAVGGGTTGPARTPDADDQATAAVPAAGQPADPQAPGWNRSAVDPFATAPMPATRPGAPRPFPHPQPAGDPAAARAAAPAHTMVDDAPTEALPVVEPAAADEAVAEWRPPKQTSRLTTILIIALLIAVGFLAGVFVGRAAAPSPSNNQPQPAATSSARPSALR